MIRLCGGSLGLLAFAIALLLGLSAGNPPEIILERAVAALFIFCGLGLGVGWVGSRVLDEHAVRKNREMFPPAEKDEAAIGEPGPGETVQGAGRAGVAAR